MINSKIKVVRFTSVDGINTTVSDKSLFILPDGHPVAQKFIDTLKAHLQDRAHVLDKHRPWTLKQICSSVFWKSLSQDEARTAGKCASFLARTGQVPLLDTQQQNTSNARLYLVDLED